MTPRWLALFLIIGLAALAFAITVAMGCATVPNKPVPCDGGRGIAYWVRQCELEDWYLCPDGYSVLKWKTYLRTCDCVIEAPPDCKDKPPENEAWWDVMDASEEEKEFARRKP